MASAQYKYVPSRSNSSERLIAPPAVDPSGSASHESIAAVLEDHDLDSVAEVEVAPPPYRLQPESMSLSQMRMKRGVLCLFHDAAVRRNTYASHLEAEDKPRIIRGPPGSRRRLALRHDHDPSLRMVMWQPCAVIPGAVGYYDHQFGVFVTLFNAFQPLSTATGILRHAQALRHVLRGQPGAQVVEERESAFMRFFRRICPTRSAMMHSGDDEAIVLTDDSTYRYIEDRAAARMWFSLYIDEIVSVYGYACNLRHEDIIFVTGTLDAPRRAIAVSDANMSGRLCIVPKDVLRAGEAWAIPHVRNQPNAQFAPGSVLSDGSGDVSTVLIAGMRMHGLDYALTTDLF